MPASGCQHCSALLSGAAAGWQWHHGTAASSHHSGPFRHTPAAAAREQCCPANVLHNYRLPLFLAAQHACSQQRYSTEPILHCQPRYLGALELISPAQPHIMMLLATPAPLSHAPQQHPHQMHLHAPISCGNMLSAAAAAGNAANVSALPPPPPPTAAYEAVAATGACQAPGTATGRPCLPP